MLDGREALCPSPVYEPIRGEPGHAGAYAVVGGGPVGQGVISMLSPEIVACTRDSHNALMCALRTASWCEEGHPGHLVLECHSGDVARALVTMVQRFEEHARRTAPDERQWGATADADLVRLLATSCDHSLVIAKPVIIPPRLEHYFGGDGMPLERYCPMDRSRVLHFGYRGIVTVRSATDPELVLPTAGGVAPAQPIPSLTRFQSPDCLSRRALRALLEHLHWNDIQREPNEAPLGAAPHFGSYTGTGGTYLFTDSISGLTLAGAHVSDIEGPLGKQVGRIALHIRRVLGAFVCRPGSPLTDALRREGLPDVVLAEAVHAIGPLSIPPDCEQWARDLAPREASDALFRLLAEMVHAAEMEMVSSPATGVSHDTVIVTVARTLRDDFVSAYKNTWPPKPLPTSGAADLAELRPPRSPVLEPPPIALPPGRYGRRAIGSLAAGAVLALAALGAAMMRTETPLPIVGASVPFHDPGMAIGPIPELPRRAAHLALASILTL